MAASKKQHTLEIEDTSGKEAATWSAQTSAGALERSRKFSQSVLEAGEPKLLSVKDKEITLDSFYQFVDEYQPEDANEDLLEWLDRDKDNGVVQVYTPGSTYCDLVKCTISTNTDTVMAKCLTKELYVQYGGRVRKLGAADRPLHVQNEFLRSIGYEDAKRIQLEGISPELGFLFKLVAGLEVGEGIEDQIQLSGTLRVKESGIVSLWSKRHCVLIGSKILTFASRSAKGKPSSTIVVYGCTVEEYRSKKWTYGIRITGAHRPKSLCLGFSGIAEQSKWLKRLQKAVNRHPNEVNLSGYSLARIPPALLHDKDLSSLNFANNFLRERPLELKLTDQNAGYIHELKSLPRLNILSLSGNNLLSFPLSVCRLSSLSELDLSSNQLQSIPTEICLLSSLRTLNLDGNQLLSLPSHLSKLKFLSSVSLSFNNFDCIPEVLKKVSLLKNLTLAGNHLQSVPEEVRSLRTLENLDLRMNDLSGPLPQTTSLLPCLSRLNLCANSITEVAMSNLPVISVLLCSNNLICSLAVQEGPLKVLVARDNCISQISVRSIATKLTVLDLSRNSLSSLPEGLCSMPNLERLDLSENQLLDLPPRMFVGLKSLKVLKLSQNKISVIPNEIASGPLQELDLHGNQIVTLPPWLLVKLSNLEILNVSDNQLAHLPAANHHGNQNSLTDLLAGMNHLKSDVFEVVSCLKKLKVLVLCHNKITEIPNDCFKGSESLQLLSLSGNPLSVLPSLEACVALEKLTLSGCRLTSFTTPEKTKVLQEVDLSHNDLESLKLSDGAGRRMKYLDLSGNVHLELLELPEKTLEQLSFVEHVVVDEMFEFDIPPGLSRAEQIGQPSHGAWSYGTAHVGGQTAELPYGCCSHVAVSSVNRGSEAVYAIVDGGRSRDACSSVKTVLAAIVEEEYDMYQEAVEEKNRLREERGERLTVLSEEDTSERLMYLRQSMLSCHRKMGVVGSRWGASVFTCHLVHDRAQGSINLNLATTGSCEGLLGRRDGTGSVIAPHSLRTNKREMQRVADLGAVISEDYRLNSSTCTVSRLLGHYHLWPFVIPYPDVSELVVQPATDRFLLLANDQVWSSLSHATVERIVNQTPSSSYAAKKVRDAAIASGCRGSVSVLLLKFNQRKMEELLGSKPAKRPRSARRSVSLRIPEDTHHYRLEVDTPGPLIDISGANDHFDGLHSVEEVTDIDALCYSISPDPENKWTNLDEPISPLTPPPGFGFEGGFSSSTPHHAKTLDSEAVVHNRLDTEDTRTKQGGDNFADTDFSIEYVQSGILEEDDSDGVFDLEREGDGVRDSMLSSSLPNLLEPPQPAENPRESMVQYFDFYNSDNL